MQAYMGNKAFSNLDETSQKTDLNNLSYLIESQWFNNWQAISVANNKIVRAVLALFCH